VLRFEPRGTPSNAMVLGSPLIALALTMIVGTLLFIVLGQDPATGLSMFFWQPIRSGYAWSEIAMKAVPLVLIALGLSLCYRANVWNIGAEGQYILGAICAGGVAIHAGAGTPRGVVIVILAAGVLGGMAWAAIVALLRDRFNANEILVSLMLVYVAEMLLGWLVYGPWKDPGGFNFPQTINFPASTQVPKLVQGWRMNAGVFVALAAVVAMTLFLFRSLRGFQAQVSGLAPAAASYAGFSARANLWTVLLVSGGFAGLAGALEVAGPIGQLTPHVPAGYGFAAIVVAFVGRLHPVGVVFAAILMSMFVIGGELAQSRMQLPKSVTGVFQGLLLFSLLACDTFIHQRLRRAPPAARREADHVNTAVEGVAKP
jgi:general nucleoside transport system permease protein